MTYLAARLLPSANVPPVGDPHRRRWQREQDRQAALAATVRAAEADRLVRFGRYRRGIAS